jgi:hypothetical protein
LILGAIHVNFSIGIICTRFCRKIYIHSYLLEIFLWFPCDRIKQTDTASNIPLAILRI